MNTMTQSGAEVYGGKQVSSQLETRLDLQENLLLSAPSIELSTLWRMEKEKAPLTFGRANL